MLKKQETRGRGARYGALAGLLSVFLMCAGTILLSGVYGVFKGDSVNAKSFLVDAPLVTLGLFYYAIIFGGFLAIPFGAIAGFVLTTDPKTKPR